MEIAAYHIDGGYSAGRIKGKGEEYLRAVRKAISGPFTRDTIKVAEQYTAKWQHKPSFDVRIEVDGWQLTVHLEARGENANIWHYVSEGTRPHKIRVRNAKALTFFWDGVRGNYNPRPRTLPINAVVGGSPAAVKVHHYKEVDHPGSAPRHLEDRIHAKVAPLLRKHIHNVTVYG